MIKRASHIFKAVPEAVLGDVRKSVYDIRHMPGTAVFLPMAFYCAEDVTADDDKKKAAFGFRRSWAMTKVGKGTQRSFELMKDLAVEAQLEEGKTGIFMTIICKKMVRV